MLILFLSILFFRFLNLLIKVKCVFIFWVKLNILFLQHFIFNFDFNIDCGFGFGRKFYLDSIIVRGSNFKVPSTFQN